MALDSLDRGLSVLKYIAVNGSASVSEIARAFEVNKSTASRILSVLATHNLISKNERTLKYYPDVGALALGCRPLWDYLIPDVVHPQLNQLADRLGFTAQLCVLRHGQVYMLDQVKSVQNRYIREPAVPGMTEPLHCSAVGKCILAYQPPAQAQQLLAQIQPLHRFTENTIASIEALEAELEEIRLKGCAWDRGELSSRIWCLAVPLHEPDGSVRLSLGFSGDRELYENKHIREEALKELLNAAREIEKEYVSRNVQETGGGNT